MALASGAASDLDGVAEGGFGDALDRWRPRIHHLDTALHLRQAARFGATLVIPGDEGWPTGLDDLGAHAPAALWVRGDARLLGRLDLSDWHVAELELAL